MKSDNELIKMCLGAGTLIIVVGIISLTLIKIFG